MKLLTNKKQNEALARIAVMYVMARKAINGVKEENRLDYIGKLIDDAAELAYIVGGIGGMVAVKEMVESVNDDLYKEGER